MALDERKGKKGADAVMRCSRRVQEGACVRWQAAATPLAGMLRSSIQPIANGLFTHQSALDTRTSSNTA